jgi:hypothetical protein
MRMSQTEVELIAMEFNVGRCTPKSSKKASGNKKRWFKASTKNT